MLSQRLRHFSLVGRFVIAASATGVSPKTEVREELVLMDQRWLQRVNKLLPRLNAGNPEEKIWITLQQQNCSRWQPTLCMTMYQTRHSGARIHQLRGFRVVQEVRRRGQWRACSSVRKIRQEESPGGPPTGRNRLWPKPTLAKPTLAQVKVLDV